MTEASSEFTTLESNNTADVALSPDGTRLYAALKSGDIDVFDVNTHAKITTFHISQALGAISLSDDGSFLVASDPRQPLIYKIDTSTGAYSTIQGSGAPFFDVQVTDANDVLLTRYNDDPIRLDLTSHAFSYVDDNADFSGRNPLVRDGNLTLIAETGDSGGELLTYNENTNSFGGGPQGRGSYSPESTFNYGSQAISEKAGLVLQYAYSGQINVYDLSLDYVKTVNLLNSDDVDGLAFDKSGKFAFVNDITAGKLIEYDVSNWNVVASYAIGTSAWHNNIGYGDQILITDDGKHIAVSDYSDLSRLELIDLSALNETLTGTGGDDTLSGYDGDDVLDGGKGHDMLIGGTGNDTYIVDSIHDTVIENANEGTDTVIAAVSWTLGTNLENLTLSGTHGNTGAGNELDNHIVGNAGDNMLVGLAGNDVLDGGLGHDTLVGGTGNDLYFVDSAHDTVVEKAGEGNDTVVAAVSWTLGDNLENLTLSGMHGNSGTGNALDNTITGNSGDNHLSGMAGNDTMVGGDGNDVLLGGAGRDVMIGGAGNDHFVFAALSDFASAKGGSADEITDFATGDKIDLSSVDAIPGGGHDAFGWLGTAAFDGHAGELRFYEQAGSTYIQADLNGDKVTDFAIKLDGVHALTAADFAL